MPHTTRHGGSIMSIRFVLTFLVLMGISLPVSAAPTTPSYCDPHAMSCLGEACTPAGATTMNFGGYVLMACLNDTTLGYPIWKAMAGGGGSGGCFTYYCTTGVTHDGTPCVDFGGTQKHCPSGSQEKVSLGVYGACHSGYVAGSSYGYGHFSPSGSGCTGSETLVLRGQSYLCCLN